MQHLPGLDGLRAVAIALVLWQHAGILFGLVQDGESTFWRASKAGWLGVDLFFVLSGLLITRLLLRAPPGRSSLTSFWKRRAARTLPLLYVYLLVAAAYGFGGGFDVRAEPWLAYVSHTTNLHIARYDFGLPLFGMLWSLGVEEQFYVFWPLVVKAARPWLGRVCVALIVAAPLSRVAIYHLSDCYAAFHTLPFCRADTLALGAGIALCMDDRARWAKLVRAARFGLAPALAVLALVSAASLGPWTLFSYRLEVLWVLFGYSLVGLSCATLVVLAADGGPIATRLLANRPAAFVGKISYGIYLWHCLLAVVVASLPVQAGAPERLTLWIGLVLVVSSASFFGIERPWLAPRRLAPQA